MLRAPRTCALAVGAALAVSASQPARAQTADSPGDVQALNATPTSPPPSSASSLRRELDSETQLRLGGGLELFRVTTAMGGYDPGYAAVAGSEGFWVHRLFTAGFDFAIGPLFLVPGAAMPGPPVVPRPTDLRVVLFAQAGLYATLHFGHLLRVGFDPSLTIGIDAALAGGPGAPDLNTTLVSLPARAMVSFPIASRLLLGPYIEFSPYFPVGCGNAPCGLPTLANVGVGIALTITTPPPQPPRPPRPPPPDAPLTRAPEVLPLPELRPEIAPPLELRPLPAPADPERQSP